MIHLLILFWIKDDGKGKKGDGGENDKRNFWRGDDVVVVVVVVRPVIYPLT